MPRSVLYRGPEEMGGSKNLGEERGDPKKKKGPEKEGGGSLVGQKRAKRGRYGSEEGKTKRLGIGTRQDA